MGAQQESLLDSKAETPPAVGDNISEESTVGRKDEDWSNLANLSKLPYTKEVLTGAEYKHVNLFDRALNEKQSGNKNIIKINIFGCLSQNAISTGVATYFSNLSTVAYKGVA